MYVNIAAIPSSACSPSTYPERCLSSPPIVSLVVLAQVPISNITPSLYELEACASVDVDTHSKAGNSVKEDIHGDGSPRGVPSASAGMTADLNHIWISASLGSIHGMFSHIVIQIHIYTAILTLFRGRQTDWVEQHSGVVQAAAAQLPSQALTSNAHASSPIVRRRRRDSNDGDRNFLDKLNRKPLKTFVAQARLEKDLLTDSFEFTEVKCSFKYTERLADYECPCSSATRKWLSTRRPTSSRSRYRWTRAKWSICVVTSSQSVSDIIISPDTHFYFRDAVDTVWVLILLQ